ncbi:MAG: hypothetical protein EOM68_12840 [Spirochaetia bacterium]|nr:hypothetical protein [Spirochaetia bacterium]
MVPMRRSERKMENQEGYRLLSQSLWVTLSTVNARRESPLGLGSPYAVPISVVACDGRFFFHCALQGHKIDNLKADNRVCITCVGSAEPDEGALSVAYESATFFATAEEVTIREEKIRALDALCKRFAPSQNATRQIEAMVDKTGVWELHILGSSAKQRKFE